MESTTNSSNTPTMNVGGVIFSTTKQQLSHHDDHSNDPTTQSTQQTESTILVAKGKSHLSYFYMNVCSSVLYLAPETSADDNTILIHNGDDSSSSTNAAGPVALEIYYHKAVRAKDLQWATVAYMENNLQGNNKCYSDLPLVMQQQILKFNDLYQNVKPGDRYLLSYIPGYGIHLQFNNELLGIVGMDLPSKQQQHELARLIYSVWFGHTAPFSESMKKELLTPLDPLDQHRDGIMESPALLMNGVSNAIMKGDNAIPSTSSKQAKQNNTILSTSSNRNSSNSMTKEESELLDSLGILQLLDEEKDSAPIQLSEPIPSTIKQSQLTNTQPLPESEQPSSAMTRIRHFIFPPKTAPLHSEKELPNKTSNDGFKPVTAVANPTPATSSSTINHTGIAEDEDEYKYNPILLGLGGALFLLPHLAVLLSLPPVLQRRGAPYLPTFGGKLNTMFDLIRNHTLRHTKQQQQQTTTTPLLRFVDLGSGDGRVVFRAAREGTFAQSTGYEINPALHLFACCRKIVTPKYWSNNTNFYMRDLWKVKLHNYDVVAVYGLSPIMERLGEKMKEELKPGSIVVSNVFAIPGWRVSDDDDGKGGGKGVFLYRVPECFGSKK